jgi:CRP/FNR family transcriptional regulator
MTNAKVINSCTVGKNEMCCFEELSDEELDLVEQNVVQIEFEKGETICKQGTFASHIIVLDEGLAKIYKEGGNDTLILKILPAVNIIGLNTLFEGNNVFQYSAMAYLKSKVRMIEIGVFKQLISTNAKFAAKIISLLSENTVITYGRFFCLTKKQTYGRFADILLCLSQRIYKQNDFPLQLSRKELAELACMSVESITRILTKFKDDGLIKVGADKIEILDVERLNRISLNG